MEHALCLRLGLELQSVSKIGSFQGNTQVTHEYIWTREDVIGLTTKLDCCREMWARQSPRRWRRPLYK